MRSLFFSLLMPVHASVPETLISQSLAKRQECESKPKTYFWSSKTRLDFECGVSKMMYNVELTFLVTVRMYLSYLRCSSFPFCSQGNVFARSEGLA
jgi:hypothetical protein